MLQDRFARNNPTVQQDLTHTRYRYRLVPFTSVTPTMVTSVIIIIRWLELLFADISMQLLNDIGTIAIDRAIISRLSASRLRFW